MADKPSCEHFGSDLSACVLAWLKSSIALSSLGSGAHLTMPTFFAIFFPLAFFIVFVIGLVRLLQYAGYLGRGRRRDEWRQIGVALCWLSPVFFVLGMVALFRATPIFQATARLQIDREE